MIESFNFGSISDKIEFFFENFVKYFVFELNKIYDCSRNITNDDEDVYTIYVSPKIVNVIKNKIN